MTNHDTVLLSMSRWQSSACWTGAISLAVWLVGAVICRAAAFQSYWFAWVFWSGLACGSVVLCCLQFLTRGAWSFAVQRPVEAGTMTLPLMALLLVPALFGMKDVFPWASPDAL